MRTYKPTFVGKWDKTTRGEGVSPTNVRGDVHLATGFKVKTLTGGRVGQVRLRSLV